MHRLSENPGDLMLYWMSANGSGKIPQLRDAMRWLLGDYSGGYSDRHMSYWLNQMEALSYCEVNWSNNSWRASPSQIVRLPNADGAFVYTGKRRRNWADTLIDSEIFVDDSLPRQSVKRLPLPQTVIGQFDAVEDALEAASFLDAAYCGVSARKISDSLTTICLESSAPPATNADLERFISLPPWRWKITTGANSNLPDGLYRESRYGRKVFTYKLNGEWLKCDLPTGMFTDLKRKEINPFQWEATPGRANVGSVYLKKEAVLPASQLKALTLCSGRAAEEVGNGGVFAYMNVPRKVYERVASSLLGDQFEEMESA